MKLNIDRFFFNLSSRISNSLLKGLAVRNLPHFPVEKVLLAKEILQVYYLSAPSALLKIKLPWPTARVYKMHLKARLSSVKKGNQAFTFNRVKGKKQDFYPPLVIQNKTVDNGFFPEQSM